MAINIDWKQKSSYQLERLIHIAYNIQTGFYQKLRFYVLPFLPEKFRDRVVYFPKVASFVSYLASHKLHSSRQPLPRTIQNDLEHVISEQLEAFKNYLQDLEHDWKLIEKDFLQVLEKHFPNRSEPVIICPSPFGSVGQYTYKGGKIYILPRFERKIGEICKLIITAFTHFSHYPDTLKDSDARFLQQGKWKQKQELSNEIASLPNFQKLLHASASQKSMVSVLASNFSGSLALESVNYLSELNYPIQSELSSCSSLKGLTKSERLVLEELIKERNQIVTFECIGDILWGKRALEKFSLYAITKLMERIRSRLRENGIVTDLIHTQRGTGYVLYD